MEVITENKKHNLSKYREHWWGAQSQELHLQHRSCTSQAQGTSWKTEEKDFISQRPRISGMRLYSLEITMKLYPWYLDSMAAWPRPEQDNANRLANVGWGYLTEPVSSLSQAAERGRTSPSQGWAPNYFPIGMVSPEILNIQTKLNGLRGSISIFVHMQQ